jgi:hypothetical protein
MATAAASIATHLCEVSCVVLVALRRAVEVVVLDLCSTWHTVGVRRCTFNV